MAEILGIGRSGYPKEKKEVISFFLILTLLLSRVQRQNLFFAQLSKVMMWQS